MTEQETNTDRDDRCTNCGRSIDVRQWHLVKTVKDDGLLTTYTFCSQQCHDDWEP